MILPSYIEQYHAMPYDSESDKLSQSLLDSNLNLLVCLSCTSAKHIYELLEAAYGLQREYTERVKSSKTLELSQQTQ